MFRFPKSREIAEKWNKALGIDSNIILYGYVCADHFENECFAKQNKTVLKPNAVPTINVNSQSCSTIATAYDMANDHNYCVLGPPTSPPPEESVQSFDQRESTSSSHCNECIIKDELIELKDNQIRTLRNKLLKKQKKVWQLETINKKLNTAFSQLKKQFLINEEQLKFFDVCLDNLEVFIYFFFRFYVAILHLFYHVASIIIITHREISP